MSKINAIEQLQKRFKPEAAKNMSATYLMCLEGENGGQWLTKIHNGTCEVTPYDGKSAVDYNCKITISTENLEMILAGRMPAMTAALSGMLAIDGELGLAMQLVPVFFDGAHVPFI